MEKESFFVEIKDQLQAYVEDRLLLLRLQATEKAATISAALFISIIVAFIGLALFLIITFIAGYCLSKAVNSYPGGFGILGGMYLLCIFLLVYIHKKYLAKAIVDKVVKFSMQPKETFTNEV